MRPGGQRIAIAAFLGSALFTGGNAVGIRFSNRELEPLWGGTLRFGLTAALLLAVMATLRLQIPRGRALTGAVLYGVFNVGAAFALLYVGFLEVQAGVGQTVLALVPLATLLLAALQREERVRPVAVGGALIAFAGIAVISQASLRASVPPASVLALVGSAFCFGQAAIVVRRFPPVHPVTINALGMVVGAAMLLAGAVVLGESIVLPAARDTWLAVAYLVVVGSGLVFVLNVVVLEHWDASRFAYVFVLIPFVTVFVSAWLDDEPIGAALLLGGPLVLAGVYVGALRPADD